jgi:K+/H+ antiporter YhaU regulatory subunit KhtT
MSLKQQVKVIREQVPELVGQTIAEANIRDRTGCTVVAIERGDEVITEIGATTGIEPGDEVVVAGTDDGIHTFERVFDGTEDG